jgi:hypothetical protein
LSRESQEAEDDSYKRWDEVFNTDALPQEDAMHIIIGLSKRERAQYYSNVVSFVDKLIDIGEQLIAVPEDQRSTTPPPQHVMCDAMAYSPCSAEDRLERDLKYLGEHLVDGLYLPICGATDSHHCIVRLLPQESIPLHSKARVTLPNAHSSPSSLFLCSCPLTRRLELFCLVSLHSAGQSYSSHAVQVPYLFFYEIIESGEKCSAPNLHNFNLESARLGAGVPGVLSPFDEPNAVADPGTVSKSKAKSKSKNASPVTTRRTHSTASDKSVSPLTPSRRVKVSSIVRKMGYYSQENLSTLQDEDSDDDDGEWTPDSPFADDRPSKEHEGNNDGQEQDEDASFSQKIDGDGSRSESDVAMLEKLYEMGKRSDESDSESQHEESESEPKSVPDAPVEEPAKPEEPQQPSTALAVVPVDVTKNAKPEITLCSIFGESWKDKENRIRKESPYSHLPNWSTSTPLCSSHPPGSRAGCPALVFDARPRYFAELAAVIVKSGDDLRQEQLVRLQITVRSFPPR